MRGLVTAGRVVRLERIAGLGTSVAGLVGRLLIAQSRVAPRAAATAWLTKQIRVSRLALDVLEDGQGPAPAGQFSGDGDVGDHTALVSGAHGVPAVVHP